MRDSITLYRTQVKALLALPPDDLKSAFEVIVNYALDDIAPECEGIPYAMWMMVKPLIDKHNRNYENGKKGGRPETELKPNNNPTVTELKPTDNPTVTELKPNSNPKNKEESKKDKKENNKNIMSGKPAAEYPYKAVTDYLNEKTGKAFLDKSKDTRKLIKARIDEGFTADDFYKVIDNTVKRWKGDPKMCDYLRPSTLFGTKFESYLNMGDVPVQNAKKVNFPQRDYDMKQLEKALTGR